MTLKKIMEMLEDASYIAYSDITADERQLHGNVATVVNLETAKAIVRGIAVELEKHLILLNERLKEEPYPWISTDALILQAGISQLKEVLESLK